MMNMPRSFHLVAAAVIAGVMLTGCQDTLIYGESTAFNLAIHANDNPQTPIEVNAGLKRYVGEMAPPVLTKENDQGTKKADGEAVSSFSGFALTYDPDGIFGELFIRTQFASGVPAQLLAEEPRAAIEVINATFDPIERDAEFVTEANRKQRAEIVAGIKSLEGDDLTQLACNPPLTSARLIAQKDDDDPGCVKRTADPEYARLYLMRNAYLDDRTDAAFAKWKAALHLN